MAKLLRRNRAHRSLGVCARAALIRIAPIGLALLIAAVAASAAHADTARFDLIGPKVEARVTRAGVTLPIASVPNLQPGDRLWLHPALPPTQSVRYLMVLTFLRGTTNPPPDNWFFRIETWDKKVREEGVEVTVPDEAQQAVLFLAPVTGGDFGTLRSAVQGRPGIFVRASQDLTLAGFEQARIERYIAAMAQVPAAETLDPKALQADSNRIAGTLALKPNPDCFKQPPDQQYTCLTQSGGQTLLDDGHGQTIVAALSSGPGSDFINQASYTQAAGAGVYSAYVGAVVDLVHIMSSLHTAQYQYIPAIAFPQQQQLNLRLNTAPSFHNPKSVIVIGLPSIQSTSAPPLRPTEANEVACLAKPGVVLPVEGAPLVYSTGFAHDLMLHLNHPGRDTAVADATHPQNVPLSADAYKGGLVLATIPKRHPLPEEIPQPATPVSATSPQLTTTNQQPANSVGLTGTIQGFWGFDPFTGPTISLQTAPGKDWRLVSTDPIIAGSGKSDQHVLISSSGAACIQSITLEAADGAAVKNSGAKDAGRKEAGQKETWKPADQPNTVDVSLNLSAIQGSDPGAMQLGIRQYGDPKAATLSLVSYSEPAKLTALEFHSGDAAATLTGSGVDQVRTIKFAGATFTPELRPSTNLPELTQPDGRALRLELAPGASVPNQLAGSRLTAEVVLKDGRTLTLPFVVEAARPSLSLIGKALVQSDSEGGTASASPLHIRLASQTDLPISDALLFSLKSTQPFPRAGKIEIASLDDSLHTTLSVTGESLILEDPHTILAKLEPLKAFGPSAFGPLRLRAVAPTGATGDWLPLVNVVRLPSLTGLSCQIDSPAAKSNGALPSTAISAPSSVDSPQSAADPTAPPPSTVSSKPSAQPDADTVPSACTLTGSNLYLIDSIAADAAFTNPVRVPDGFVGSSLTVPAPTGAVLYLRLRDDPTPANTVTLPAGPL
jgi:hypothetical protein